MGAAIKICWMSQAEELPIQRMLLVIRWRMRLGESQREIAQALGLSQGWVSQMLQGMMADVRAAVLMRAARRYGIDPAHFTDDTLGISPSPENHLTGDASYDSESHGTLEAFILRRKVPDDLAQSLRRQRAYGGSLTEEQIVPNHAIMVAAAWAH